MLFCFLLKRGGDGGHLRLGNWVPSCMSGNKDSRPHPRKLCKVFTVLPIGMQHHIAVNAVQFTFGVVFYCKKFQPNQYLCCADRILNYYQFVECWNIHAKARSVPRRPSWWQTTPVASTQIWVNGQKLETVTSFKYLGSVIIDEGSKPEILSRIAQTTAALTRLRPFMEWHEYFSQLQDTADALPCHIHLPVCLWIMDPHSRAPYKNTSHGNEVLPQDTIHLIQRLRY